MRSGQPVGRTVPAIQVGGGAVDGADLVERELRVREDDVSRVSTTSFCGLQRIEESLVRPGVRHYAPNVGQRLCGRHTRASSAVERSDRRCAALGLHAVQQHGALFAAQLLHQRHGVLQDEAEVGILRGVRNAAEATARGRRGVTPGRPSEILTRVAELLDTDATWNALRDVLRSYGATLR